ncbi:MAG: hypothetical protein CMH57_00390 [Myxococcales bacterium]|nr:hypothetical protein [Myxococcales bacterium]
MKFQGLDPQIFLSILAAVALVAALLYLLKMRRRRVTVPFSPIWNRVVQSEEVNRWWDRLKRLLSFLFALLIMATVLTGIADPRPEDERQVGRDIVLLVDTSASMSSLDVSGGVDRLDIARQEAIKVLETMGPLDSVMLVTMDGQLRPLTPFVKESAILQQQLKDLKTTATPADIRQAMQFVRDAVSDRPNAEIYVFSDGVFTQSFAEAAEVLPKTVQFKHVTTGESGNNVAITAFNVRRYFANTLNYEIFIELKSYFKRDIEIELKLSSDGEVVEKKSMTLGPEETRRMFFPNEGFSGKKLEARVVVKTADARDVFPTDDRAYAILPSTRKMAIALVTEGNLFLEAPLVSNENISYSTVTPEAWEPSLAENMDIVIFDRFTPPELPEQGRFMLIDPKGESSPWAIKGEVEGPEVTKTNKRHPLMRWVTLQDANIQIASKLTKTRKDEVAAQAGPHPLIVSRREEGRTLVGVAFDIRNSELPLKITLPVLMLNAVDYFMDEGDSIVPTYKTGEAWTIPVSKKATKATITSPDGTAHDVPVYRGRAIFYGELTGFHSVKVDDDEEFLVAANLSDTVESAIQPPEALELADRALTFEASETEKVKRQDWWVYLVFGALALLLLEWVTYNRRWTV